jgi:NADH:ubiquinone oxidoreductase subunit
MALFDWFSTLPIRLFTLLHGKKVGEDHLGNRYYTGGRRTADGRPRRWVLFNGAAEATNVPAEWHGWLHYQTNVFPQVNDGSYRRAYQQPHQPNLTGTENAYRPPGHTARGGNRAESDADYEAWTPPA